MKDDQTVPEHDVSEEELPKGNQASYLGRMVERRAIGGKYTSEKKNITGMLLFSIIVNAMQFILLLFFAVALMMVYGGRDVSVKIPPGTLTDTTLVFGSTRVNKPVYEIYADYLARSFGNFTYENIDETYKGLMDYAAAERYHNMRRSLSEHAEHVKDNFITQKFKLQKVELAQDKRGVLATCTGFMTRKVGSRMQFERLPYKISFWLKPYRGNLMIMSMSGELNRDTRGKDKVKVSGYVKDNKYVNF